MAGLGPSSKVIAGFRGELVRQIVRPKICARIHRSVGRKTGCSRDGHEQYRQQRIHANFIP